MLVHNRLSSTEARLSNIDEQTHTRLDLFESKLETVELAQGPDKMPKGWVAALEKSMKDRMDQLARQLRDASACSAASAASGQDILEPLDKIAGFLQETFRGIL